MSGMHALLLVLVRMHVRCSMIVCCPPTPPTAAVAHGLADERAVVLEDGHAVEVLQEVVPAMGGATT